MGRVTWVAVVLMASLFYGCDEGVSTTDAARDLVSFQDVQPQPDFGPQPDTQPPPPDMQPPDTPPPPPDTQPDGQPPDTQPDAPPPDAQPDAPPQDATPDTAPDLAADISPPPDATGTRKLTVRVAGQGTVTATTGNLSCDHTSDPCQEDYANGSTVTLNATPAANNIFVHWSEGCSGLSPSVGVVVDANKTCMANFLGVTGNAAVTTPPTSVVLGANESALIRVFVEQVGVTLTDALPIDVHVPDVYDDETKTAPGVLPAGTIITTYLIHYDPVGIATASATATLTLPRQILGLGYSTATLNGSDPTGNGVTYPAGNRALELPGDPFTLRNNRVTLDLTMAASTGADQIRVVTRAGAPLPIITSSTITFPTTPPASVAPGQTEDSTNMLLLEERQNVNLSAALAVNITDPGTFPPDAVGVTDIAVGTSVDSYLLHFDPVGGALATTMATVTFDRKILGLVVSQAELTVSTTALGLTSTVGYPTGGSSIDIGGDIVYFSGDRRSLRINVAANTGIDQMRVVLE